MAGRQGAAAQLVQYVALRGDLLRTHKWPVGAMVAQGCHACTAVIHTFREEANVAQYLSDLDRMHKIVLEVSYTHFSRPHPLLIETTQTMQISSLWSLTCVNDVVVLLLLAAGF